MEKSQDDYINPKYLPEGITLKQFHHLKAEDATSILAHWMKRRDKGKVPFRFKKIDKATQRKQANSDSGGACSREEELPEEDEETQVQKNSKIEGKVDDSTESCNVDEGHGGASESPSRVSWFPKYVSSEC
jgi:hypothetical protein